MACSCDESSGQPAPSSAFDELLAALGASDAGDCELLDAWIAKQGGVDADVVVPSRGLKVPTHLRRRTSVTRAAGALLSPAKGAPWQPREDGMMMPALQLIEAYVRERAAVAMGQGGGGA